MCACALLRACACASVGQTVSVYGHKFSHGGGVCVCALPPCACVCALPPCACAPPRSYESRAAFEAETGRTWPGDFSMSIADYMQAEGIAILVVTAATYMQTLRPEVTNPRAEIIVLQKQVRSDDPWGESRAEDVLPSRSCLADAPMGFRFRTGLDGARPCVCTPADTLNCDATADEES